ncbi:LANO_0F10066g1_1 [Lachancea nothofagi CBS 11611]|uniref:LANO_0F10066g1_1 n=1 Tax=Lachancea nothofagi CBS 11611 TaxID=1266666 RepID=A0A1G4KA83_9SACH|nr:LANO_0F10066g1_1 [Lachancea nothofagi CBS 11611]
MPCYFAIIGAKDNPIYEAEFTSPQLNQFPPELKELNPFILHASLDIVEDLQWQTHPQAGGNTSTSGGFLRSRHSASNSNCYLGKIDHFYGLAITAYLSYGNMKFVMIHSSNSNNGAPVQIEDGPVKSFYQEVHELYVKTLMNPFYKLNDPITSPVFDNRVRALAKRYLTR